MIDGDPRSPSPAFRFRLRGLFIVVVVASLVCWGLHFAARTLDAPFDAYATWDGANLIIQHLDEHDGRWPEGWHDLEEALAKRQRRTRGGQSIEELQRRLTIEFDVDLHSFAASPSTVEEGLPKVVRLRNGRDIHWAGAEPNELIYRYLRDPPSYLKSGDYW